MECGLKSRVIRDYDIFIGNKRAQSRARASKFARGVKFQLRRFVRNFPPCKTRDHRPRVIYRRRGKNDINPELRAERSEKPNYLSRM